MRSTHPREVWFAADEIKEHRQRLGLTLEQAAARVSSAMTTARVSPRLVQETLSNIESGKDGFVSIGMSQAIRLGLGLRSLEDSVIVQGRLLAAALRRSGMALDTATRRIAQFASDDLDIAELAIAALRTSVEWVDESPVLKCNDGKNLWAGLDQHAQMKHSGTVMDSCDKCVSLLTRAENHVNGCDQCLGNAAWLERQRNASRIPLPLEVAKALGAVLGVQIHRLTGTTAHQRRQLYGVTAA